MKRLWTLGHSTRPMETFLDCLRSFDIQTLVDIRLIPSSRRVPHFSAEPLKKALHHAGIEYLYLGDDLGGRRPPKPESRHVGLRGPFQAYADWMDTSRFRAAARRLAEHAQGKRSCTVCAERPPAGCHRSKLSDVLTLVHGFEVRDIMDAGHDRPHVVTPGVLRQGDGLLYEAPRSSSTLEEFKA